jgi:hypothetical protein
VLAASAPASSQFRNQEIIDHSDATGCCQLSVSDEPYWEDEWPKVRKNAAHGWVCVALLHK